MEAEKQYERQTTRSMPICIILLFFLNGISFHNMTAQKLASAFYYGPI